MQEKIILLSLDLSSAFDTVSHPVLLENLKTRVGINGSVQQFSETYLDNRHVRRVMIENENSHAKMITTGVPQGSILGPKLFLLYLIPLFDFLDSSGITYHFYADDSTFL